MMITIRLIANKKLYDTINIPVPNPPRSKGLTLIPVKKKTNGVKSKIINPTQILFFLFFPVITAKGMYHFCHFFYR